MRLLSSFCYGWEHLQASPPSSQGLHKTWLWKAPQRPGNHGRGRCKTECAIVEMPSPTRGQPHSLPRSRRPRLSSPECGRLRALPRTGHADTLLSGHEPFLPTPSERRDEPQAHINKHYTVLGSQQQGNRLRAPAHMAEKPFTNWDQCRRIFCPWQRAHTVGSVTPGVSYTPGVSLGELWRL